MPSHVGGSTPKPPLGPVPISLDALQEVPDPAARVAKAPTPAAVLPSEPSPTRADRRLRARATVAFVAVWIAAAVVVAGVRPDLGTPGVVMPILAWLAGGALILGLVLRPRARGLPVGVRVVQHAVWVVPAAYVAGVFLVAVPEGESLTWASMRTCLALSTAMALGPVIGAALFLRRSFLSAPGWRGAAVGALAGLGGSIGVHAHCPCQSLGHLLAAHGAAIGLGAVAGAALGHLGGRS